MCSSGVLGGLNIDASRVGTHKQVPASISKKDPANCYGKYAESGETKGIGGHDPNLGRWPANLIHDGSEEVVRMFPVTGQSKSGGTAGWQKGGYVGGKYDPIQRTGYDDQGSAARFFKTCPPDIEGDRLVYVPKASKADRDSGCDGLDARVAGCMNMRNDAHAQKTGNTYAPKRNTHPTVKPLSLMKYLIKLICPPNGTVLDCFMGSGSTGKAAMIEGFKFIGVEREAEYFEIAKARIAAAIPEPEAEPDEQQLSLAV